MKTRWYVYVETGEAVEAISTKEAIQRLQGWYPHQKLSPQNVLPETWAIHMMKESSTR
jgi:hypothetical protein